jgi:hypothetical protein
MGMLLGLCIAFIFVEYFQMGDDNFGYLEVTLLVFIAGSQVNRFFFNALQNL